MATHSSTLAWRIPWTEEPGRLQSMGSHRVGHNLACMHRRETEGSCENQRCVCFLPESPEMEENHSGF